MTVRFLIACITLTIAVDVSSAGDPTALFNGRDLTGWEGDPKVWSVNDGAIVGRTTADAPIENNTFLIWKDGQLGDFRITLQYRIDGGNSGVQYRAKVHDADKWIVGGYQADIDSGPTYTGILYDERGRGILALRGQRVQIAEDGNKTADTFADAAKLQELVKTNDWNDYVIEARGERLRHFINDHLMSETIDADRAKRTDKGVLALQVHTGPPMTVKFRKIMLETLTNDSPDYEPKSP
jgi:hypothetical protein